MIENRLFTALLAFTFCLFGAAPLCSAADRDNEQSEKLRSLMHDRVALADRMLRVTKQKYEHGAATVADLLSSAGESMAAHLAICETKSDKIAVLTQSLQEAKVLESQLQVQLNAGKGTGDLVDRASLYRLNIEISLLRVSSDGMP